MLSDIFWIGVGAVIVAVSPWALGKVVAAVAWVKGKLVGVAATTVVNDVLGGGNK